jgi:hypothetical protein
VHEIGFTAHNVHRSERQKEKVSGRERAKVSEREREKEGGSEREREGDYIMATWLDLNRLPVFSTKQYIDTDLYTYLPPPALFYAVGVKPVSCDGIFRFCGKKRNFRRKEKRREMEREFRLDFILCSFF